LAGRQFQPMQAAHNEHTELFVATQCGMPYTMWQRTRDKH
jgi:hypothetical protein